MADDKAQPEASEEEFRKAMRQLADAFAASTEAAQRFAEHADRLARAAKAHPEWWRREEHGEDEGDLTSP